MLRHSVETCPDDVSALEQRLDALTGAGARIISVVWQARRTEDESQSAAYDARGSFVIVSETHEAGILRERQPVGEGIEEIDAGRA